MSIWDQLVGQAPVVDVLTEAIQSTSMTHAWLFTGPPGSGRSVAAKAFAAALQCPDHGCGVCESCTIAQAGSHPDIGVLNTQGLSIGVDTAREYVRRAALHPARGRWQILIIEDADRLTEQAGNALLKSLEEPPARTVWMLCAPSAEDVIVTIRSRCRTVGLRTPSTDAVADLLVSRDGVDRQTARHSAAAASGHIGRARALATDEDVRARRREVLMLPGRLTDLGACVNAASTVAETAKNGAQDTAQAMESHELDELRQAWGVQDRGRRPAGYAGARSELEKEHKRRRTRLQRDAIDYVLLDLMSFWRDVLMIQLGSTDVELINADAAEEIDRLARLGTRESTLGTIDAIVQCRQALASNAAVQLALERLMIAMMQSAT